MKLFQYFFLALLGYGFLSCGGPNNKFTDIDAELIDMYLEGQDFKERPHLKIKHSALNKEFMLYGNYIPMLNSPTGYSLKGRIVQFKIFADRVVMLESPKGHSLSDQNESTILLAEFPIVSRDNDGVLIDFAKGMNTVFTARNILARAVLENEPDTSEQFKAIFLVSSFIKSIEELKNILVISQVAQWRNEKTELISAEFRYFLREYNPSPTFKKEKFGKSRWLQYFSTPPMVEPPTTKTFAYITKWDLKDPIVFYLSDNTPEQYHQAITDGLTFWNHIFGQEIITVKKLHSGIRAPYPLYNIVQWVPWDNEASAYADIVTDHLTGQIMQAQIYIRSGWVMESAKKLRTQLEELLFAGSSQKIPSLEEHVPLPVMFDWQENCQKDLSTFNALLDLAILDHDQPLPKEHLTLLTADILRTVVAHEMGHILGLRHNLAGSLYKSISIEEHNDLLKNYLQTGSINSADNFSLSSSIMDVFSSADDALMGAHMRQIMATSPIKDSLLKKIYIHDAMAIDVGYFDGPIIPGIPFCSDDDMTTYNDCRRWDFDRDSILFTSARLNSILPQIAILLADTIMLAQSPDKFAGPTPIKDIPLTSAVITKTIESYIKELLSWFNKNARSVKIEAQFEAFGPHNQESITKARFNDMKRQIEINGVKKTLFDLLPPLRDDGPDLDKLAQLFKEQLKKRLSEQSEVFLTDKQIDAAQEIAHVFFTKLHQEIIDMFLSILAKAQFDDENFQEPIEKTIGQIGHEIIFSRHKKPEQHMPQFTYDTKTRELATKILSPALGVISDWSFDSLTETINELKNLMRPFAVKENKTVNLNEMARSRRQWLLEQNRLLDSLMNIRNQARTNAP